MQKRELLIASFIFPERLNSFYNYLENKFNIKRNNVFLFNNLDDDSKVIVTFKLEVDDDKRLNLKQLFSSAVLVHKKGSCFFTIDALNLIIELESKQDKGNINYKDYKIDWQKYQNKILLTNNQDIIMYNIQRCNQI